MSCLFCAFKLSSILLLLKASLIFFFPPLNVHHLQNIRKYLITEAKEKSYPEFLDGWQTAVTKVCCNYSVVFVLLLLVHGDTVPLYKTDYKLLVALNTLSNSFYSLCFGGTSQYS